MRMEKGITCSHIHIHEDALMLGKSRLMPDVSHRKDRLCIFTRLSRLSRYFSLLAIHDRRSRLAVRIRLRE